nr:probable E3 ubiquitin-protein ligase ARI8 [Ipomoea trifida]
MSKVLEEWFANEEKVWIAGEPNSPIQFSEREKFRCEICGNEYPVSEMALLRSLTWSPGRTFLQKLNLDSPYDDKGMLMV